MELCNLSFSSVLVEDALSMLDIIALTMHHLDTMITTKSTYKLNHNHVLLSKTNSLKTWGIVH